MRLAGLHIYPVKSLGAVAVDAAPVEPWGLAGDRRWMVVDAADTGMTQRTHPAMARLRPLPTGSGLSVSVPGGAAFIVATPGPDAAVRQVTIWNDRVPARDAGGAAARAITEALGTPCRLVWLADPRARPLKAAYAADAAECVSFADGFPLLLTTASSLADLNARLAAPVPMARFRPNLVIEGAAPWAEDGWRVIRIGGVTFQAAKPCDRCAITTTDQDTGERPDPKEPLRTLAAFRRLPPWDGVLFGQNLVPLSPGVVRVGDGLEVLEHG